MSDDQYTAESPRDEYLVKWEREVRRNDSLSTKMIEMQRTLWARDFEIAELKGKLSAKHEYACRMDALAEERNIEIVRLRADVAQLQERIAARDRLLAMHEEFFVWRMCPETKTCPPWWNAARAQADEHDGGNEFCIRYMRRAREAIDAESPNP